MIRRLKVRNEFSAFYLRKIECFLLMKDKIWKCDKI